MTSSLSSANQTSPRQGNQRAAVYSLPSRRNFQLVEQEGQLEVHTSSHRGSFSMVFSEALRSAGLGSQVLIAQFLKGGVSQGPKKGIQLCGRLEWLRPDFEFCLNENSDDVINKSKEIVKAIDDIWEVCLEKLQQNKINKLVLDEIGLAIKLGFIAEETLISALENRPKSIDVIITGPLIPLKIMAMANQVTQLRCSK